MDRIPVSSIPCFAYAKGAPARLWRAPDLAGGRHHELQLTPLFFLRQQVTGGCRREAALGAQSQVLDRDVAGRLVDAAEQLVLRLQPGSLAAHQAENDHLIPG